MLATERTVGHLQRLDRLRTAAVLGGAVITAVIAGLLIGVLGPQAVVMLVGLMMWMLLAALFWRSRASAVLFMLAAALLVEHFPIHLADQLTEHILLFRTLNTLGVPGLLVTPVEILLATAVLVWTVRGIARRDHRLTGTATGVSLAILLCLVAMAAAWGLAHGGSLQIVVNEVRPFLYVAVLYLLASHTMRSRGQLWALLWVDVLATGFKGIQGTYRSFAVRGMVPPPETILGHEEAVFLSLFILLTAGLWLFGVRGRLRLVATLLLPFVVLADLANQRRTAWLIMAVGLLMLLVGAWAQCRERRRIILVMASVGAVGLAVYLPVFWNSAGQLAQPARALRSAFAPSDRDNSSDQYRVVENTNLALDIRANPLGYGFGRAIPHPIPPTVDANTYDPLIDYVPHNAILYIWLRTGSPGALAFWFTIGAATMLACRVVRLPDRRLALLGTFGLMAIAATLIESWYDQGLMQYRTAFLLGCVLGTVEAARRIGAAGMTATRAG